MNDEYFRPLTEHEKRFGYLISHTRLNGALEIPLTDDEAKNTLIRHWATGNGRFQVEEFSPTGELQPPRGDAWEGPVPAVNAGTWVRDA